MSAIRTLAAATATICLLSPPVLAQVQVQRTESYNSPAVIATDGGRVSIEYKTFNTIEGLGRNAQVSVWNIGMRLENLHKSQAFFLQPSIEKYIRDPSVRNGRIVSRSLARNIGYVESAIQAVVAYEGALSMQRSTKSGRHSIDLVSIRDLLIKRTEFLEEINIDIENLRSESVEYRRERAISWQNRYKILMLDLAEELIMIGNTIRKELP